MTTLLLGIIALLLVLIYFKLPKQPKIASTFFNPESSKLNKE
ncbi:hypothetical protein P7L95_09905 [Bisgaard Taxon 10/6]|nr:hypothetical protein [Exercitatus varius]MDG2957055.1 hypothetical protein [Exercitatus varius]MDG2965257.1 hypothetical protein [Exercitatus varius]